MLTSLHLQQVLPDDQGGPRIITSKCLLCTSLYCRCTVPSLVLSYCVSGGNPARRADVNTCWVWKGKVKLPLENVMALLLCGPNVGKHAVVAHPTSRGIIRCPVTIVPSRPTGARQTTESSPRMRARRRGCSGCRWVVRQVCSVVRSYSN